MSSRASSWAWEYQKGLTLQAKLVLLHLADRADSDGKCWPSTSTIAADVECSERSVQRSIAELMDANLLERTLRAVKGTRGGRHAALLQLRIPEGFARNQTTRRSVGSRSKRQMTSIQTTDPASDTMSLNPVKEPSPTAQTIVAAFVDAHRATFGADPTDTGRLAREVNKALKAGWTYAAVLAAANASGTDAFGASSLTKHLRDAKTGGRRARGLAGVRDFYEAGRNHDQRRVGADLLPPGGGLPQHELPEGNG